MFRPTADHGEGGLRGGIMKEPIIHKAGPESLEVYQGLGYYKRMKAPYCVGAKAVWKGKRYYTHRLWKYVTCKHCLKKRQKNE